ncbi:MAG: helix-turn-helix domain-containing protein [Denitromonas halophila]|nr:MAG: helix-turn-helix domain-containing protein [Denitromonas halophila]
MKTLMTKEDLMELLQVSKRTIDTMIAKSDLPAHTHIGRRLYWRGTDVATWIDARFGVPPRQTTAINSSTKRRGRPRAAFPS